MLLCIVIIHRASSISSLKHLNDTDKYLICLVDKYILFLTSKGVFLSSVRNAPDVFYPMKCTRTVCAHNRNRVRRAPRFEVVQKEEKWRQLCLCVHLVECVLIKWAYSRLIIAQVNAVYKLFKIKKCYYLIKRHISGLDVRKC